MDGRPIPSIPNRDAASNPTSSPIALDCGRNTPGVHTDCTKEYLPGATVTLTAHPDTATTDFTGFSGGGCSGTEPCLVTMDAARTVAATFTHRPTTPTIAVDPASANLGAVPLGQTSVARTFTVKNTSSGVTPEPLVLGSAAVHGAGFALAADSCSGRTMAPGETCTLATTFSPTITGGARHRVPAKQRGRQSGHDRPERDRHRSGAATPTSTSCAEGHESVRHTLSRDGRA